MITVKFLSGFERRLGLTDSTFIYRGPAPISFRALCAEMKLQNLEQINKPAFANYDGRTYSLDEAFTNLNVSDGKQIVMFMLNGGG